MGLFFGRKPNPAEAPWEVARREKINRIKQTAQVKLQHYLSAPFTAQCVSILRENINAGKILRPRQSGSGSPDSIQLKYDGIYSGTGNLCRYCLINFNAYGYNNLSGGEQCYGFFFALCQLLGSEYEIVFQEDPYSDSLDPYIVRKQPPRQYRDI